MKKYTLFIGSDNITGELRMETALEIVEKFFDGFTFSIVFGVWKGKREDTLKVEIVSENDIKFKIANLCHELKTELRQEAILVEVSEGHPETKFY